MLVPRGRDHPPNMNPLGYDHSSSRSQSGEGSSNKGRVIDAVISISASLFSGARPLPCVAVSFFGFPFHHFRLRDGHCGAEHALEITELILSIALRFQFFRWLRDWLF